MNRFNIAVLGAALLLAACGGKDTTASRSAAAYREAQAKGTPVGGGDDHGHEHGSPAPAPASTAEAAPVEHSAHGAASAAHAGMDHGSTSMHTATDHATMSPASHSAMNHGDVSADAHAGHSTPRDHAAMQHGSQDESAHGAMTADAHAGMQHGTPATPADSHVQHQAASPAHAGHGAAQSIANAPSVVLSAPTSNADMARTRPSETLRSDDFDAPAAIAVEEAKKAASGGHVKKEK